MSEPTKYLYFTIENMSFRIDANDDATAQTVFFLQEDSSLVRLLNKWEVQEGESNTRPVRIGVLNYNPVKD
jgi:hypothetical protein